MRFPFTFARRVGAGVVPVLGADVAPVTAADLAGTNVFRTKISASAPAQRIAVGYQYTGAGVPLSLAATGYVFDGTSETWLTVESLATTIKPGDIGFFSVPHLITEPQVAGGDPYQSTVESLEFALVVAPAGGDPAGLYTFLVGVDVSEVEDEQAAGAVNQVEDKIMHLDLVATNGKLDALHGDVDGVEAKLDTLHADLDTTLHTDLATTLAGKLDTIHADVDGVEAKLDTLHADLDTTLHTDLATTIAGKQDTGNLAIAAIGAQLPATLGAKTTAGSLAVALPTDLQPFKLEAPGFAFTTLRTLVAAVADVEPVDGSAWVAMPGAAYAGIIEIPLDGFTSVGGTIPPSQVAIQVWARMGAGGAIRKVHEETLDATRLTLTKLTNPYLPRQIPFNAPDAYITFTFPDGTAPTITGVVKGRMIAQAALTAKDLPIDVITRALRVMILGYDQPTDTIKNSPALMECDLALPQPGVLNTTGLAHTTPTYYPSTDGALMHPFDSVSFDYSLTAAGGGTISTWWECSNGDGAWTIPQDITLSAFDLPTKSTPVASPITSAVNGTIKGFVQFDHLNAVRVRQAVRPNVANSGAAVINMRSKVRGS